MISIIFIIYYIWGLIGLYFFNTVRWDVPEKSPYSSAVTDYTNFNSFSFSLFTLFQIMVENK